MKISSRQIAVALMALIGVFFVVAAIRQPSPEVNGAVSPKVNDPEAAFLEEARELQEKVAAGEAADAALPSVDEKDAGPASIALETYRLDLGVVPVDEMTKKEVMVFNRGKGTLVLNDIKTTCACTKGAIPESSKSIPPGGQAPIEVIINPFLIRGFDAVKTLSIYSNDPERPWLDLQVSSRVEPEFIVEPEGLDLGTIRKGQSVEKKIIIRQNTDQEFILNEVTLTHPTQKEAPFTDIELLLTERAEAEWQTPGMREYEISMKTVENLPLGALLRYFYIMTNLRRVPYYPFKITGVVESFYTLDPSVPNVVTLARQAGSMETVTEVATIRSEQAITITDLEYDENFLEVGIGKDEKKNATYLLIKLKAVSAGELDKDVNFTVQGEASAVPETVRVKIFGNGIKRRAL